MLFDSDFSSVSYSIVGQKKIDCTKMTKRLCNMENCTSMHVHFAHIQTKYDFWLVFFTAEKRCCQKAFSAFHVVFCLFRTFETHTTFFCGKNCFIIIISTHYILCTIVPERAYALRLASAGDNKNVLFRQWRLVLSLSLSLPLPFHLCLSDFIVAYKINM